jgi:hypothetical protein
MRAGRAFTQLVEFTDGHPDGNITWQLLDGGGTQLATGTVTPAAEAVSSVIRIEAVNNGLVDATALSEPRELQWSYEVGGLLKSYQLRYRIDAFLPFGVSEDGVRRKLGLELHELEDADIDLVTAYSKFRDQVTSVALAAADDSLTLEICNAVEAMAAVVQIPTLQVRLAVKESSGTDQFQRASIDWDMIRAHLDQFIAQGIAAVNPAVDLTANFGSLVQTINRDDPVTGTVA